jgi:hypothetical protein
MRLWLILFSTVTSISTPSILTSIHKDFCNHYRSQLVLSKISPLILWKVHPVGWRKYNLGRRRQIYEVCVFHSHEAPFLCFSSGKNLCGHSGEAAWHASLNYYISWFHPYQSVLATTLREARHQIEVYQSLSSVDGWSNGTGQQNPRDVPPL